MTAKRQADRPEAPQELDGESLLEWDRVCGELDALGTLNQANRAIIALHCQMWAVFAESRAAVAKYGAVVKWPNGVPGPSPFYRVMRETATVLRGTLRDLGLSEARKSQGDDVAGDLDI